MPEEMDMNLQADLDLLNDFDTGVEWEETADSWEETWLDYYYNMMLPELEEGKFSSDEKLDFVRKILST